MALWTIASTMSCPKKRDEVVDVEKLTIRGPKSRHGLIVHAVYAGLWWGRRRPPPLLAAYQGGQGPPYGMVTAPAAFLHAQQFGMTCREPVSPSANVGALQRLNLDLQLLNLTLQVGHALRVCTTANMHNANTVTAVSILPRVN